MSETFSWEQGCFYEAFMICFFLTGIKAAVLWWASSAQGEKFKSWLFVTGFQFSNPLSCAEGMLLFGFIFIFIFIWQMTTTAQQDFYCTLWSIDSLNVCAGEAELYHC